MTDRSASTGTNTAVRELIINVDDIGIHEGAVAAAIETITGGVAASGSVMTVCPGTAAALDLLADRPTVPVGVHLTLVVEDPRAGWAPLTTGPTIQHQGRFHGVDCRDLLLATVAAREVEAEFRAQIEVVLAAGVRPTHLDWHCLADGGRPDLFALTLELALEYGTSIRAWTEAGRRMLRERGLPAQDQPFLDSFSLPVVGKAERVLELVRALPPGRSELAMHPAQVRGPGHDAAVRNTDRDVLLAPALRRVLAEEQITILGYADPRLRFPAAG